MFSQLLDVIVVLFQALRQRPNHVPNQSESKCKFWWTICMQKQLLCMYITNTCWFTWAIQCYCTFINLTDIWICLYTFSSSSSLSSTIFFISFYPLQRYVHCILARLDIHIFNQQHWYSQICYINAVWDFIDDMYIITSFLHHKLDKFPNALNWFHCFNHTLS